MSNKRAGSRLDTGVLPGAEIVRLLVGPDQREFDIHEKLLCASSSFFRDNLEAVSSVPSSPESELPAAYGDDVDESDKIIWLSEESPEMFELFILWLYQRNSFVTLLDQMVMSVSAAPKPGMSSKTDKNRQALHWNLVKLHLFAAATRLPALQDHATDALQDLYLRCDWDVSTRFVRFLYEDCSREQSFRLRKWAVAMLAWTVNNGSGETEPHPFTQLFDDCPELLNDYFKHMDKMASGKSNARIKNPQLRLHANKLRNEERHFGFRQCSFHSHRSAVGEGKCPHILPELSDLLSPITEDFGATKTKQSSVKRSASKKAGFRGGRLRSASGSIIWTVHESTDET